jgi:hypothetical protein
MAKKHNHVARHRLETKSNLMDQPEEEFSKIDVLICVKMIEKSKIKKTN